jgi:IS5 family transposase
MHQTKKGNQWYFGMKAHVGVDSKTKIIHTAASNVADSAVLPDLLNAKKPEYGVIRPIADRPR